LSATIRADAKEGDVGTELGVIAKAHPGDADRQLSVLRRQARTQHQYRGTGARPGETQAGDRGGGGDARHRARQPCRCGL